MSEQLPPGQPQVHVVVARQTSTLAVLSLVFGILGILGGCCTFGVFSIIAVLCGHPAMKETKSGALAGNGMAVAGLVLGYLGALPAIVLSIMMVFGGLGSSFQ